MRRYVGFNLIEFVIFILVIGLISAGVLTGFYHALPTEPNIQYQTTATGLAKERMELILGQARMSGFSSFTDPCTGGSPPAMCTPPTGYTVDATITDNWDGDTNFKVINVDVTGNATASLQAMVADY